MKYRTEKDGIGEIKIPAEAYYGINTIRSKNNFDITKRGIPRQMIKALAYVKKAAAKANYDSDLLTKDVSEAIMLLPSEPFQSLQPQSSSSEYGSSYCYQTLR